MHKTDVDPDLERQLQAAGDDEPIEAVLMLRQLDGQATSTPEALVERVCEESAGEVEMNYMPRIGALIVRGPSGVIRRLIDQPEVEIASANRIEDLRLGSGKAVKR